jgi:hypothetical protein
MPPKGSKYSKQNIQVTTYTTPPKQLPSGCTQTVTIQTVCTTNKSNSSCDPCNKKP